MELTEKMIQCPYCGERYPISIDPSEGDDQFFVYDCEVCCRPIDVTVTIREGRIEVRVKQGGQL